MSLCDDAGVRTGEPFIPVLSGSGDASSATIAPSRGFNDKTEVDEGSLARRARMELFSASLSAVKAARMLSQHAKTTAVTTTNTPPLQQRLSILQTYVILLYVCKVTLAEARAGACGEYKCYANIHRGGVGSCKISRMDHDSCQDLPTICMHIHRRIGVRPFMHAADAESKKSIANSLRLMRHA